MVRSGFEIAFLARCLQASRPVDFHRLRIQRRHRLHGPPISIIFDHRHAIVRVFDVEATSCPWDRSTLSPAQPVRADVVIYRPLFDTPTQLS